MKRRKALALIGGGALVGMAGCADTTRETLGVCWGRDTPSDVQDISHGEQATICGEVTGRYVGGRHAGIFLSDDETEIEIRMDSSVPYSEV